MKNQAYTLRIERLVGELFISDIEAAKKIIHIDMPDIMDDLDGRLSQLSKIFNEQNEKNVEICIRHLEEIDLPNDLQKFQKIFEYVTTPVTIIDKSIIWFGQPLYALILFQREKFWIQNIFHVCGLRGNIQHVCCKLFWKCNGR